MQLRRLFPDQATLDVAEAASGLGFSERAPEDRPYIAVNMVSSADGKATLAGRTAPMSAPVDRELFHHLRTQADGILVGAGTVRIERYGRVTKTEELQAKREREGLRANALAVVVSASGNLPADLPLLVDAAAEIAVVTDAAAALEARASLRSIGGSLPDALRALRREGIRSLLCEGGPTLNSTLFAAGLVDELFLTIAPTIAGAGEALTIVEGPPLPRAVDVELLTLHEADGHLFARYRVL